MTQFHFLGFGAIGKLVASLLPKSHFEAIALAHHDALISEFSFIDAQQTARSITIQQSSIHEQQPIEFLIICCKAHQVLAAFESVAHRLSAHSQLLIMCNGMGPQFALAQRYPQLPIYVASITHGAFWQPSTHTLRHTGLGNIHFGLLAGKQQEQTIRLFKQAFDAVYSSDILSMLWQKLIINAVINPLTVKYNCQNGALIEHQEEIQILLTEIEQLHLAKRCPIKANIDLILQVCNSTASNYSSMHCDYHALRNTEIEHISGYLIQQATELGLQLPQQEALRANILARNY